MGYQTVEDGRRVYEELLVEIKEGKGVMRMAKAKKKMKSKKPAGKGKRR